MDNWKLKWRYIKRICGVMGGLLIFLGIIYLQNYMYVKDIAWERILWHNFYNDTRNIDNIYLGSSHVYCDINPMQLDEINGQYNFNLSSSGQRLNGSYYLLQETDKSNSLSHVYLELFYLCSTKNNFNSDVEPIDEDYTWNWRNTDYMRWSYNKFQYLLSSSDTESYIDALLPFVRYRTYLDNWNHIKKTMKEKDEEQYLYYRYYNKDDDGYIEEYMQQGYHYSTREFLNESRIYYPDRILEKNPLGEKSEKYLRKIICYCQERNIPITLFISPIDKLQLIGTEHYDNYINQVKEIAEEYDVPFYDFNLVKEEYLPIQHGEYFMDISHLNASGASMFTSFFSEVVSGDVDENKKYFYASYAERLQEEAPAIYGLYYREPDAAKESARQGETLTFRIASNREQGMEYRIILTIDEEEGQSRQQMLQDFSENKEFTIPVYEHGICTIVARMKDNPEEVQTLEVNY